MKGFFTTLIGFLFIVCPFTILIGIVLIDKELEYIEIENKGL